MSNERLRIFFCDHLNLARSKYVPFKGASNGEARFCQGAYAVTYDKQLIPAPGSKMLEGLPDMVAQYQGSEIREGWFQGDHVVISDLLESDGSVLDLCGRSTLKRISSEWQSEGLTPKVGIELEAFAFVRDDSGHWVPYDTPGAFVYSTGPFTDPIGFTDTIWDAASECGFPLELITSEYDSPQFEFTLRYDDAVKAVDDSFLFRLMARELAYQQGVLLTFLPKPVEEAGGSGVHINFSFFDSDGQNRVGDSKSPDKLSELGRNCVAGLMHHHQGLAGILAPTVNSYARLQPASLSGYWQNWGEDHRGVTVRISSETGIQSRIEHRMADGAANPYVATAAVLAAAKLGVENNYDLQPAETGDCLESQDADQGVAENLSKALTDLENDSALCKKLGETLVQNHVFVKQTEIETLADKSDREILDYYIHYI